MLPQLAGRFGKATYEFNTTISDSAGAQVGCRAPPIRDRVFRDASRRIRADPTPSVVAPLLLEDLAHVPDQESEIRHERHPYIRFTGIPVTGRSRPPVAARPARRGGWLSPEPISHR